LGKGQVEQEGRMRSSRRVCRSKRRAAISKRIVVRSMKSVQVQKKWNEVQKSVFLQLLVSVLGAKYGYDKRAAWEIGIR
jgi:hypothetical protein